MEIKGFNLVSEIQKRNLYYFTDENVVKEVYNIWPINADRIEIDYVKNRVDIVTNTRSLIWFSKENLKELSENSFLVEGGSYFCLGKEGCISALSFHNNRVLNSIEERIKSSKQTVEKIKELDNDEYTRQWNLYFGVFE